MSDAVARTTRVFQALSKRERLAILFLMVEGMKCPSEFAAALKMRAEPIRQALNRLMVARLVEVTRFHAPREFEFRLHESVRVTDSAIEINADGLPISVGRELAAQHV
jgi:DNA-binding transcriptional ArsR family regulator